MADWVAILLIVLGYIVAMAVTWGIMAALKVDEDYRLYGTVFWPLLLAFLPFYGIAVGVKKLVENIFDL